MKIQYTESALIEIGEIFSFIAKDNVRAAAGVADRARTTIDLFAHNPYLGHVANEAGVRSIQVGRFPYLIFYAVEENEMIILQVRHAARGLPWDRPT
jgi:toxin ParE1/3/4